MKNSFLTYARHCWTSIIEPDGGMTRETTLRMFGWILLFFAVLVAAGFLAGCAYTGGKTETEYPGELIEETDEYYIIRVSSDTTTVPKFHCYGDCPEEKP